MPGYGFGLGSRVLMDPAGSGLPGSAGEFGWAGAANTYFWVDRLLELVGILMTPHMIGPRSAISKCLPTKRWLNSGGLRSCLATGRIADCGPSR